MALIWPPVAHYSRPGVCSDLQGSVANGEAVGWMRQLVLAERRTWRLGNSATRTNGPRYTMACSRAPVPLLHIEYGITGEDLVLGLGDKSWEPHGTSQNQLPRLLPQWTPSAPTAPRTLNNPHPEIWNHAVRLYPQRISTFASSQGWSVADEHRLYATAGSWVPLFTARRARRLYAVAKCQSVCLSVCHTPVFCGHWTPLNIILKITTFEQYLALSRKWCKIEPQLLWKANRKLHPIFRSYQFEWSWVPSNI